MTHLFKFLQVVILVVIRFKTLYYYQGFSYTQMISSVVFYPRKGVSLRSKGRISIFKRGVSQSSEGRGPKNLPEASPPDTHQSLAPPFHFHFQIFKEGSPSSVTMMIYKGPSTQIHTN